LFVYFYFYLHRERYRWQRHRRKPKFIVLNKLCPEKKTAFPTTLPWGWTFLEKKKKNLKKKKKKKKKTMTRENLFYNKKSRIFFKFNNSLPPLSISKIIFLDLVMRYTVFKSFCDRFSFFLVVKAQLGSIKCIC
jgi:hypothetical protein